ncbi:MAG: type II secretion system F family protein [Magnetococcales bacterium]|nr:type II secretion system F family protein [Magnetococcales bacterium]
MAQYYYKAATPKGSIRQGWLKADNERDLELRLSKIDLLLISHNSKKNSSFSMLNLFPKKGVDRKVLILFCAYMEQMLAAGNSILVALEGVQDSTESDQLREVVASMMSDINNGASFSDALGSYSEVFPVAIPNMVRVGERTGRMVEIFKGLGDNLKWEDDLQNKAIQAIRYPAITGLIIMGVGFFMMSYIVPQLMGFLTQMGEDVPTLTKALINFSDFLINWWWSLFLVPFLAWVSIRIICRKSQSFYIKFDRFKLNIWFFGPLLYKIFLIRFTSNFALMYSSGVPILEAIELNGRLSENREIVRRIQSVVTQVSNGHPLSSAFKDAEVFPPPLPKLMEAGEEGGQLGAAMMNASYFLDREVRDSVSKIQGMIEPMLTLVMGSMLVWIILSVFLPIYQVIGKAGL